MTSFAFGEEVGRWVAEASGGCWTEHSTAIGQFYDGQLIVGILYDGFTGKSITMHSRCDDPKHVNRTFYWMIFDYPFNQLKIERITLIVSTANKRAQRVNEKLGFRRETTLSDYFPDGDAIIYIMRREQCRWLGVRNDLRIAA